jgi:hypothetical protein
MTFISLSCLKFEDRKEISRSRVSKKDSQYNSQTKKDKRKNNDLQNTTQKSKDWTTRTPLKTEWTRVVKIDQQFLLDDKSWTGQVGRYCDYDKTEYIRGNHWNGYTETVNDVMMSIVKL